MRDERLTARITGRVQGVGFRWWAQREAEALELVGWIMNADDERSVEVVAEGADAALTEFARRLETGPPSARVDSFESDRRPASGEFHRFGIMRS